MNVVPPNTRQLIEYDEEGNLTPDFCPVCGVSAHVNQVTDRAYLRKDGMRDTVSVIYRCPRNECGAPFIAEYEAFGQFITQNFTTHPTFKPTTNFSEAITDISPAFLSIFRQAEIAKKEGLSEIYGLGLRKALEFLIKDYCIHKNPEAENAIKSELLGKTISTRFEDSKVRISAQRAAWLGNDHAHYVRKWTSHEVEDLEALISLTINAIESEILLERFTREMPEGKK